jgi:hypothetical protein
MFTKPLLRNDCGATAENAILLLLKALPMKQPLFTELLLSNGVTVPQYIVYYISVFIYYL